MSVLITSVEAQTTNARATPQARRGGSQEALTTLPLGTGLPVVVQVGAYFADIASIDDNEGTFTATVDLRLRWTDSRLGYAPQQAPGGFKESRTADVEARLSQIWTPDVRLSNMVGEPSSQMSGLREYPDGRVELMQRTTAQFATPFEVERFPFDRQKLRVELVSHREGLERVTFNFRQDDLDFSRVGNNVVLDGWMLGLVDLHRGVQEGWYGQRHARLWAALEVRRQPGAAVAPIFIPLFAALLIPLLAIWLNKVEKGEFQIEAFELTNIIVGGLFTMIALNFTVNSEYRILASDDNLVKQLFSLNYLTLAVSLVINIVLFRFNLVQRAFGKYVQEQLFLYLMWAVPVLALVSAVALLLVAIV
ncbi:MAG TPA: hypothetical protein VF681_00955 [Abditibacteriaceae bacterium]|jgi:hypothetical protein